MLRSKNRLKLSSDFDELFKKGTRYRGEFGMLLCLPSKDSRSPKIGFVVSKKIGNAVERHLFERRVRHIVRDHLEGISEKGISLNGVKCSYIAYKKCAEFKLLRSDLTNLLEQAVKYYGKS